ncbi:MAG: aminotransferase class I/II-fold pyridoxal phosphate-dependent enzyme [Pseudomonadota bacterium]
MHLSSMVDRVAGQGARAWEIHEAARKALEAGEDILMLSIGDPDFPTPDVICDAAIDAMRAGDTHYTEIAGRRSLRTRIADRHSKRTGISCSADNVIVLSGAQCALFSAMACLAEAGDEVIVLDPAYVTYEAVVRASGARMVRVQQPAETGFRPDIAAIESAISNRTKVILLTNPNNPTGVIFNAAEIEAIADIARRHDLWVVSDEVYSDLVFEGRHLSIAALPGMAGRTVTVDSLSKSHAMTGWRTGWAIAPESLVAAMENLALAMLYGLPGFIQTGAETALASGDSIVAAMRDTYRRRRDCAVEALSPLHALRFSPPQAGMFLMIDVRQTGLSATDFSWGLLRAEGVSVLDAAPFGRCAEGHIRVSFTLDEARTSQACQRIANYLQSVADTARIA